MKFGEQVTAFRRKFLRPPLGYPDDGGSRTLRNAGSYVLNTLCHIPEDALLGTEIQSHVIYETRSQFSVVSPLSCLTDLGI